MVRIPNIKIPSVRVGSIGPTSNIGTGGATPAPPTPITYLTQWKIVGNSEVHALPYPDGVVLPNGYKRCEYLTFDGSSYINTGVKTANDIGYDLRFKSVPDMLLIGGRHRINNDGFVFGSIHDNYVYVSYGGETTAVSTTGNYNDGNVHRIILDSVKFQIDNEVMDISSLRRTTNNFLDIYLGTWNKNGTTDDRMWTSNIYDTIIYNTQGELWHGIPCLDANDVPCFYDIVSQTAFYNQGSGSFTYELYPQPTEIWSCGEYNATDGKYHILVQPQGGSIADIALTEPLRKVNDVADSIEFPSDTEGKALVTRPLKRINIYDYIDSIIRVNTDKTSTDGIYAYAICYLSDALPPLRNETPINGLCSAYIVGSRRDTYDKMNRSISISGAKNCNIYDPDFDGADDLDAFKAYITEVKPEFIYELETPTTELVDAPQIQEAESYTCVISQGGKAVSWSSFETNSE